LRGGAGFLPATVRALQEEAFGGLRGAWQIDGEFHFGGFARCTPGLDAFVTDFRSRHGVILDWVYVAKMVCGLYAHAQRGTFTPGTTVVAVITG
jgi:1-aminocyclopropane-1-carboxylate deaminase